LSKGSTRGRVDKMNRKGLEYSDLEPIEANMDEEYRREMAGAGGCGEEEYMRREMAAPRRPYKEETYVQVHHDHGMASKAFEGVEAAHDRRKLILRGAVAKKQAAASSRGERSMRDERLQDMSPPPLDPLSELLAQLAQHGDPRCAARAMGRPGATQALASTVSMLYGEHQASPSRAALQQQLRSEATMAAQHPEAGLSSRSSPKRAPRIAVPEAEMRIVREKQAVRALFMQDILFSTLL